jgi:hypothetical protein
MPESTEQSFTQNKELTVEERNKARALELAERIRKIERKIQEGKLRGQELTEALQEVKKLAEEIRNLFLEKLEISSWEKIERLEEIFSMNFEEDIYHPIFSPSGNEIMVREGGRGLRIYDLKSGDLIFSKDFNKGIDSPTFSPSGNEIMVKEGDTGLRIYDLKTGNLIFSKDFNENIYDPKFSPSGNEIMVIEGERSLRVYKIIGKRR